MNKQKYLIVFFVFLTILLAFLRNNSSYQGPISDHFNGRIFYNAIHNTKKISDLLEWKLLSSNNKSWPKWVKNSFGPKPPSNIENNNVLVTHINHSTVLIQTNGVNIITDPVYSDYIGPVKFASYKRVTNPGIDFDDLPKIDIVLISHNHYDHLDLPTLQKLYKRFKPTIIAPLGVCKGHISDIVNQAYCLEMDWWENKTLLEIILIPRFDSLILSITS